MRLFIIGYKSSGKTTIGKKLAARLNMEFIDLDEVIERREGRTVPEIYSEHGDTEFRNMEWSALKEIVAKDNIIVSTGGGAPCHCDNMNLMEKYGDVLYIKLDDDILVGRLKYAARSRPIVLNKSEDELKKYIKDLRFRCEHHYNRAKYIIDGKNLTIDKIIKVLNNQA